MIEYSRLETFLRSRDFILYVVIFSVLWLTPNTYYVYYSFMESYAPLWREFASAGVALLVASGIMIYTLRGNLKIANYYMFFEISISAYYYITTIGWDWGLIPAFSFVFMLPVSLKHYTTELDKDKIEKTNKTEPNETINESAIELDEEILPRELLIEELKRKDEVINELSADKLALRELYDSALEKIIELTPTSTEKEPITLENMPESELIKLAEQPKLSDDLFGL